MARHKGNLNNISQSNPYIDKLDQWSSHAQILKLLRTFPPNTRILDVGSASGTLGRHTKECKFEWFGIEPQKQWSQEAINHYKEIMNIKVEDVPDEFLLGYQIVICADILEHLPDPDKILARLVKMQSPGTIFIISVPNIANIWMRVQLFFGHFDYTDRGILDRTHLRFFTRDSFLQLIQRAGLKLQKILTTPIPLDLVNPFFSKRTFGKLLFHSLAYVSSIFPTLLSYQWLAITKKENDDSK